MQRRLLAFAGLLSVSAAVPAQELDTIQSLLQSEFRLFSEDLGAALSYKSLSPAEPLGVTGFDIGVEVTNTKLEHPGIFQQAAGGESFDDLPLPKLHVHKGLPFGFDIGAFYTSVDDIELLGAELKYALIEGNTALPAVAVRGTYTRLTGVEQLDFETIGGELLISKGFAMITPYAGIGTVRVTSTPQAEAVTLGGLVEEKFNLDKVFAGVNLNLGLLNIAVEADETGDATSYGAKLGLRF